MIANSTESHTSHRQGQGHDKTSHLLPRTWQECQEELARRDIDPAWRAHVELRLDTIRRGVW